MAKHPYLDRATYALRKEAHKSQIALNDELGRSLAQAVLTALPDRSWYVLAIERERETCQRLADMGVQIYRPKIFCHPDDDDYESYGLVGYRLDGYVLVNIEPTDDIFAAIKATKGVKCFVLGAHGGDVTPKPLPPGTVEWFRKLEETDCARATETKPDPRVDLYEGGAVMIDDKDHRVYGQTGTLRFLGPTVSKVLVGAIVWEAETTCLKKIVPPKKVKKKKTVAPEPDSLETLMKRVEQHRQRAA
jgi:transcription antitermination factor NusG